jgi:hypothetical protein
MHALSQISHTSYSILVFICRHMSASSFLWVAKLAYMSISVYMPSALFQELYAECYGLYAKLHMLDWNMPNTMTIAMSFSMTTEQVGYLIIYMSITRLWLSILPLQGINYYYITIASVYISALRYISLLAHQVIKWNLESQVFQYADISWHEQSFSVPAYQGKSQISVCQHIMAWAKFQCASISWQEPNFSMPTYHGINLNPPITDYFGSPAYQGIYQ